MDSAGSDDEGGRRPQRQRRPSAKAREMQGIDLEHIIKRLSKGKEVRLPASDDDEEEDEGVNSPSSRGAPRKGKRVAKEEDESSSSSSSSGEDEYESWDEEEDNSEVEEFIRKARIKKKKNEANKGQRRRRRWRYGYRFEEEPPKPPPKRWRMDNFTNSQPPGLLFDIMLEPLILRDLFITPGFLNAGSDLQALGFTCKALTPLLEAPAIKPNTGYKYKYEARAAARGESWNTEEAYKVDKGVSPAFASGGQEGREISVEVDFADTRLAYPARFVAGLGKPRTQAIAHLSLCNMTSELCFELADVIAGPGMPHLVSLALRGSKGPAKALNDRKSGLVSLLSVAGPKQLPKLTSLTLEGLTVRETTWKRFQSTVRRLLPVSLMRKRNIALAPSQPATTDGLTTTTTATTATATTTTTAGGGGADADGGCAMQQGTGGGGGSSSSGVEGTRVSKAQPAGGSGKKKKAKGGGAKEEKTKKPRASAAATAKKKGSGGSKGKGIAAAKKKGKSERLPLASAPSPLLRCTELILSGGARMSQSVFAELLMGWQLFRCPVVSLTLDGTGVGGKGLAFLAQVIGEGLLPTLTQLTLKESALTDGVAASIVDGLAAGPSAVTSLTLHACVPGEALVKSLIAAAKGTNDGGSGPGLASSLQRLGLSVPGISIADRDALLAYLLGLPSTTAAVHEQALAFPALAALSLCKSNVLKGRLSAILEGILSRGITDIDISYNGGNKATVKTLLAAVKRIIPTLGLPSTQPVKINLVQFDPPRHFYWGYNQQDRVWSYTERSDAKRGLNKKWEVVFEAPW